MYTIKTLNAISPAGLAKLPVNQFEVDNETTAPQGILVRSADMHDIPLPVSWCSTPPAPTPTLWPSWSSVRWLRAAAT